MTLTKNLLIAVAAILMATTALASEPGQPIDCSDFVPVQSGLTCRVFLSRPSDALRIDNPTSNHGPIETWAGLNTRALDNEGNAYFIEGGSVGASSARIIRISGTDGVGAQVAVGGFYSRDGAGPGDRDYVAAPAEFEAGRIMFDPVKGRILVSLVSYSSTRWRPEDEAADYHDVRWIAAIEGFPTLEQVLRRRPPHGPRRFEEDR